MRREQNNLLTQSEICLIQPSEQYQHEIMDFEEWLKNVQRNEKKETAENGRPPSYEFMAIRKSDRRIVGMINVRYDLTEEMYRYLGHIGYCVRKSERQKGYAAEMLRLALKEAKKIGLDRVFLTVDSDKTALIATMKKNGAVLENEVPYLGKITQRYWIEL